MNKLFTYLLALCTATCLYGCSEELEEMTSTEESPSNIVSRSIPESFSCGTIETDYSSKTDYRSQTFLQQRYLLAECIKCR